MGIETVRMHTVDSIVRTEDTFWKEDIGDTKQVTFAFRIYIFLCPMEGYESIGMKFNTDTVFQTVSDEPILSAVCLHYKLASLM